MKEFFHRIVLRIEGSGRLKGKNTAMTLFCLVLVIVLIASVLFLKAKRDRAVKENIIESLMASQVGDFPARQEETQTEKRLLVYVCGAVQDPGVYSLKDTDRVIDLLEAAGGADRDACLDALNLAKRLADGEKVYVPTVQEVAQGGYGTLQGQEKTLSINTANAEELASLPGIGPSIAAAIIAYRESKGPFESIEEIKNVKGIGEKKFEEIKERISP